VQISYSDDAYTNYNSNIVSLVPNKYYYIEKPIDLLVWYKFDDPTNLGLDSSGNEIHGINTGILSESTIKMRGSHSAHFDYTVNSPENQILIENNSSVFYEKGLNEPIIGGGISFSFWYRAKSPGGEDYGRIFYGGPKDSAQNINSIQLFHANTKELRFGSANNDSHSLNYIETDGMPDINTAWTHITCIVKVNSTNYTNNEHSLYIYLNGVLNASLENSSCYPKITPDYNFALGKWTTTNERNMDGYLDDFRIYNKALTPEEVTALYDDTKSNQYSLFFNQGDNETISSGIGDMKVTYTQATTNTRSLTQRGGYQSPYSYYWNGAQEVTSEDAYISVGYIETNNLITSLRNASQFMISFWYRDIHNDGIIRDKTLFSITGKDDEDRMKITNGTNYIQSDYNDYIIKQFQHDQSTNDTTDYTIAFTEYTECDILILGGGGGGGTQGLGNGGSSLAGGGGGAGGIILLNNYILTEGTYTIYVGKGGKGNTNNTSDKTNGGNSTFNDFIAYGGGSGGNRNSGSLEEAQGKNGGCGGGSSMSDSSPAQNSIYTGGIALNNDYGNNGGSSKITSTGVPYYGGGGGCGMSGGGYINEDTLISNGDGGIGLSNINNFNFKANFGENIGHSINNNIYYGGGGGCGRGKPSNVWGTNINGYGGNGGGGDGESTGTATGDIIETNGLPHTGGGGGGGRLCNGGNGGSGIVIIRYRRKQILNPMTYNYLTVETSDADNLILMKLSGFIEKDTMTTNQDILSSYYTDANNSRYRIHQFQHDQSVNATTNYNVSFDKDTVCDVLIVAGGGGGAGSMGGGGGAGGYIYLENETIMTGSYSLSVGKGGAGGIGYNALVGLNGNKGVNSSILSYTAYGGGGGVGYQNPNVDNIDGGSGGGGGNIVGGVKEINQGNNGGLAYITEITSTFPYEGSTIAFTLAADNLSATMTTTNAQIGNGVYSMEWSSILSTYDKANKLFAPINSSDGVVFALGNYTNGDYNHDNTNIISDDTNYYGDWFKFTSIVPFSMTTSQFMARTGANEVRAPGKYRLYGRNLDTDPWNMFFAFDESISAVNQIDQITLNGIYYYQYAFVVNQLRGSAGGADLLNFYKWNIQGIYKIFSKGGGGGGASSEGTNASISENGIGGNGLSLDITGLSTNYAIGGNGNTTVATSTNGINGTNNLGNGGSSASSIARNIMMVGGAGGSGIVIIRYKLPITPQNVINSGLILYYPFDNTNLQNMAPYGNENTLVTHGTNTPLIVSPGRIGKACASFAGTNTGYRTTGVNVLPTGTRTLTMATWVYINNWTTWQCIMDLTTGTPTTSQDYILRLLCKSDLGHMVIYKNQTSSVTITGLPVNTWFHITVVYDGVNGNVSFYVNGNLSITTTIDIIPTNVIWSNLVVGSDKYSSTNDVLNGRIDDVRIYNRLLSVEEITLIYTFKANTVINYSPFIKINKPIDNAWHHYTLYAKSANVFGINIDNHTVAEKTLDYAWILNLNEMNADLNMSIGRGHQSGEITQSYMSDFRIYNTYDENVIKRLAYVPQYPELRIGASQEYKLAPNVSKYFDNTLIAWYRFDNAPYDLSTLPNYGAFPNIDLTIQNEDKFIVHDTTSPSSGYGYHMETSNMDHYLQLSNVEACINATRSIMFWMKNTDSAETIVKTLIEIPTYMTITIDSEINYNVSTTTLSTPKQHDNNWHHYAFIHNPSGYLDIFIDGISMNANQSNVDFITASVDTHMIIGKGISGIYLSDLRFYNDYDIQTIQYMSANNPYKSASIASYTIGTNVSKDIRPGNLQNFNVWWDGESVEGPTETIVNIIDVEAITISSGISYRNAFAYHFNNTSNIFGAHLKLENGEFLEKTLYNRFELSISYWKKMVSYPIEISDEIIIDDILIISSIESNVQLEMSNMNTITTSGNMIALETWYLYNYVIGYNKKHMSLSISVYDTAYEQVDSQSIMLPCTYDISRFKNYSGEIKLVGHSNYQISHFKIYNKLLTNAEIVAQSPTQMNIVFDLDVTNVTNKILIEPYNTYGVIASDVGSLYSDYNGLAENSIVLGNNNYISIHSNIIDSLYAIEFGFTYWKKNNIENYNTDFAMYHSNVNNGEFENHLTLTANTQDFTIYNLEGSFSNENLMIHNQDWHMYTYNMKYKNGITSNSISYDTTYQTRTQIGFVPFKGLIQPIKNIYIGSHQQDTMHIANFYIEDIKVYNSYLNESKVNTMYSNTILPIYTKTEDLSGLKLWYRLQEYTINGVMSQTITNSANNTGLNNGSYAGTNVSRVNDSDSINEKRNRYSSHSANDLVGHWSTLESGNPIDTNGFSLSNYTDFTIMYKQKILSEVYSGNYTIVTNGADFTINTPNADGNITITAGDGFTLSTSINQALFFNNWVSWAFTMTTTNSSNIVEIYKDGYLLDHKSSSLLNITNASLKIANVANIDMLLDDVRIYNRALSHNEIHKYAKGNR
jgi:hypothetical protein